jgi:hypothetical protein
VRWRCAGRSKARELKLPRDEFKLNGAQAVME